MKKYFLMTFTVLATHSAFADCESNIKYYTSESDDVGVELPLALSCEAQDNVVCVYLNNKYARVTGLNISTENLTRQRISRSSNELNISLATGLAESLIDYRYVKMDLNMMSLQGTVISGGRGLSPFDGIVITPEESLTVQCTMR